MIERHQPFGFLIWILKLISHFLYFQLNIQFKLIPFLHFFKIIFEKGIFFVQFLVLDFNLVDILKKLSIIQFQLINVIFQRCQLGLNVNEDITVYTSIQKYYKQ